MPIVSQPPDLHWIDVPQISFRTEKEKETIYSAGLQELEGGRISSQALKFGKRYRSQIERREFPNVSIRKVSEEIGHGVFAEEDLKKGRWIGEYTGIVRENIREYFVPLNNYCYEYPVPDSIGRSHVIDASEGNFTRFINHSSRPNLRPFYAFYDGFYHMFLLAIRDVARGTQLSYDYGAKYWYLRSPPHPIE